jgi:osmotically inducible protein OsmC
MERFATAQWRGDLKTGKGEISTSSNALKRTPYSFTTRFENAPGTNPEELIAAAHAACFSMALSATIAKNGFKPTTIETSAKITLENKGGDWTITASHLNVQAVVPGLNESTFLKYAEDAEEHCPVSRVLNAKVTMEARILTNERNFPTSAP